MIDGGSGADDAGPVTDDQRYADVRAGFDDFGSGEHLALFYEPRAPQLRVATAFVANALHRNRRCLYLTDDNSPETVREWFRDAGIDVDARTAAGDLSIRPASEIYLDDGFDEQGMVDALITAAEESLDDGYDGLSVAGENSWCFKTGETFDRIVDFESHFDTCCPDLPVTTLCQYSLDDFDESAIAKALRTHEYVIYRETICRNPYYLPPEEYANVAEAELNASLMLEQTYNLTRSQREIERHEQRLSVVNRILRHDIRNDLNLVLGTLDRLRETADLTDAERSQLAEIECVASQLVDRAEKARYVQQTLSEAVVERVDLAVAIDGAVATVRESHPEATITVECGPCPAVLADSRLETALAELVTNAVVHQRDDTPSVTVVTSYVDDTVTVEVVNPGEPIPEADRRALRQDIETPLEHGGGLGLWLVKWIVDNAGGKLRFPDAENGECRIAIDLQVADG